MFACTRHYSSVMPCIHHYSLASLAPQKCLRYAHSKTSFMHSPLLARLARAQQPRAVCCISTTTCIHHYSLASLVLHAVSLYVHSHARPAFTTTRSPRSCASMRGGDEGRFSACIHHYSLASLVLRRSKRATSSIDCLHSPLLARLARACSRTKAATACRKPAFTTTRSPRSCFA